MMWAPRAFRDATLRVYMIILIFFCALHFHKNFDVVSQLGFPRGNSPCVHDDLENHKHEPLGIPFSLNFP